MGFCDVLKQIMDERNMTIPDVARACGLSDSTIRSIVVRNSETVKLDVAFKISDGLGVSLERLNGDVEPTDNDLQELLSACYQLSEDNRSKLLELARLYLSAQRKK